MGFIDDAISGKTTKETGFVDTAVSKSGLPPTPYDSLMERASIDHEVPYEVLYRTLKRESSFNPNAVPIDPVTKKPIPGATAKGIAQFIDSTAKSVGVKDPFDPKQAVPGAAKYLKQLYDQFGDWKLAVAAYNQGPGEVSRAKGIPPKASQYVKDIFPGDVAEPKFDPKESQAGKRYDFISEAINVATPKPEAPKPQLGTPAPVPESTMVSPKEYYSKPWLSTYKATGLGPKPPGGFDELGRALDESGNPYSNEGVDKEKVKGPIAETLKGLSSFVTQPMETVRGVVDFAASLPAFGVGLLGAAGRGTQELTKQLAYGSLNLDQVYGAMSKGMEESFKFFEPGKKLLVGEPTETSQLVGQVAMAPMNAISALGHKVAGYEGFSEYPNIRGAAKITGDVVGLMSMGLILHGPTRRAEFAKGAEEITREASEIATKEVEVNQTLDSVVKSVQQKQLEIEKQRLETKAAEFARKFEDDLVMTEEMGRQQEQLAREKMRPVVESRPEMAEGYEPKPVKMTKAEAAKEARKGPETVEAWQYKVDSYPELKDKVKVDALGEVDTTTPPGYVQITITSEGRNGTFNVKANANEIIKKFNQVEKEWKVEPKVEEAKRPARRKIVEEPKVEEPVAEPAVGDLSGIRELPKNQGFEVLDPDTGDAVARFETRGEAVKFYDQVFREEKMTAEELSSLDKIIEESDPSTAFEQSKEKMERLAKSFAEKGERVMEDPEVFLQKLINDANQWKSGKDIPIDKVRNSMSEIASRGSELRDFFITGADHLNFMEVASEAARWARNLKRPGEGGGTRLNMMVPLDKIPETIVPVIRKIFGYGTIKVKDVYRNKELFKETGFWIGRDGKWRYELDDSRANLKIDKELLDSIRANDQYIGKLSDVFEYPEFYKLFPEAKDIRIAYFPNMEFSAYDAGSKLMYLNNLSRSTILHEVTHFANRKVGAFEGSSQQRAGGAYEYLTAPGEMEARLVSERLGLNKVQRREIPPWETLDKMLTKEGISGIEGTKLYSGIPFDEAVKLAKKIVRFGKRAVTPEGIEKQGLLNRYIDDTSRKLEPIIDGLKDYKTDPTFYRKYAMEHLQDIIADAENTKMKTSSSPGAVERFPELGSISEDARRTIDYHTRILYAALDSVSKNTVSEIPDVVKSLEKLYNRGSREGSGINIVRSGLPVDEAVKLAKKALANIKTPKRLESFVRDKFPDLLPDDVKVTWLNEMQIPSEWPAKANAKFDWLDNTVYIASNTKARSKRGLPPLTESEVAEALVHELQHLKESNDIKTWDEMAKKKETDLGDNFTYSEWKGHPSEQGPIEKGRLARGMFEDVLTKEYQTGTKLYSGIPVDEAAKMIVAGARKVAEYTNKARGLKQFKPVEAAKALKEEFNRSFIDRSGNIRASLLDKLGDVGYRIIQRMYLEKGSSSISASMLKQMRKETTEGLSKHETKVFDDVVLDLRMIDIGKYKSESEFKHPKGLKLSDFIGHLATFQYLEKLSPERAYEIYHQNPDGSAGGRAGAYYEWMKKPLKDMFDSGLISKQDYDNLVSHNYRRLEKVEDIFDRKQRVKVGKRIRTVYDSGVEALQRGRDTDIYEPSSEVMALEVFNRAYGRIMKNEANKTLLELARNDPTNDFVRIKTKSGEKIPSDWNRIFVFENGERKSLYISPEMSKEWIIGSPEISYKMGQLLRYASGSPVLRTMATGINWGFALANMPRDVMHAWFAARSFENGKWKPVYNPNFPIFSLQMGRDLASVFTDAALKKGRYQDYINEGGGMEFLVHQGRLFRRGRHLESPMDKVMDFLGYFGETSEVLTRLAIRERALRKGKSPQEATFIARDYMDFGQGGGIAKALDNAFPYLNASIQGSRGLFRSFQPGSGSALSSTYKLSQLAAITTGVYIASQSMAPKTHESLKGSVDSLNNLVIPLGDEFGFLDDKGQMRYPYIKIPLDPGQKFFKTFFEASADKWLGNEVDVDRVTESLQSVSPVGISSLPPTMSAVLGYVQNKDFWLNEDIWRQTDRPFSWPQSREEYTSRTPQSFKDLGKVTGLSPERSKYALEQLITKGTIFSYLLGQGYDAAFGDMPKSNKEEHIAQVIAKTPAISRFFGITNPYSKYASKINKAAEDAVVKRFAENRGMDTLVEGHLYDKNVSMKEVTDYAASFKDRETFDRLMDRYKFEVKIKDLPEKSFWRRMKGLPTEAKAKVFVDRLNKADADEKKQLWKEYGIVSAAGGVVGDDFMTEVSRLIGEQKKQMVK